MSKAWGYAERRGDRIALREALLSREASVRALGTCMTAAGLAFLPVCALRGVAVAPRLTVDSLSLLLGLGELMGLAFLGPGLMLTGSMLATLSRHAWWVLCLACLVLLPSFPFGTAVGVYALSLVLTEPGRAVTMADWYQETVTSSPEVIARPSFIAWAVPIGLLVLFVIGRYTTLLGDPTLGLPDLEMEPQRATTEDKLPRTPARPTEHPP